MAINTIEIMCIPCLKCEQMKKFIAEGIQQIEVQHKIKINYELIHTPHFKQADRYSVNASQAPVVIMNNNVELTGLVKKDVVNKKLMAVHMS